MNNPLHAQRERERQTDRQTERERDRKRDCEMSGMACTVYIHTYFTDTHGKGDEWSGQGATQNNWVTEKKEKKLVNVEGFRRGKKKNISVKKPSRLRG